MVDLINVRTEMKERQKRRVYPTVAAKAAAMKEPGNERQETKQAR